MKKITHEKFKKLAIKMFEGQFPNEITMPKPDIWRMGSREENIYQELEDWIKVTLDKYKELVNTQ